MILRNVIGSEKLDRAHDQLQIIQRVVDDVAHTGPRMGEFYRRRPAQLELVNLVPNAIFAMPDGGRLTMQVGSIPW